MIIDAAAAAAAAADDDDDDDVDDDDDDDVDDDDDDDEFDISARPRSTRPKTRNKQRGRRDSRQLACKTLLRVTAVN